MSHPLSSSHGPVQGTAVGCLHGGTWPWIRRGPFNGSFLFCRFCKTGARIVPRAGIWTHLWVPEEEVLNASRAGAVHWPPCGWLFYCWFIQVSEGTRWLFGLTSDPDEPIQHPECHGAQLRHHTGPESSSGHKQLQWLAPSGFQQCCDLLAGAAARVGKAQSLMWKVFSQNQLNRE